MLLAILLTLLSGAAVVTAQTSPIQPNAFERFWLTTSNNTHASSTAVDANGGIHMAFAAYTESNGVYPVYYAYCAANCADDASWTVTPIGNVGVGGRLAGLELDTAGRPRLLWYQVVLLLEDGVNQYAECNSGCTNAQNWTITTLTPFTREATFAMDHQGHPRLIYTDFDVDHSGTYYGFCDTGCSNASNWSEVQITTEYRLYDFSLGFSPSGVVHLAYYMSGDPSLLAYAYCEANCDNPDNWYGPTVISNLGAYEAFSLDVTSQGMPRLAYYTGYLGSDNPENDLLYYAWCDSDCWEAANWTVSDIGLPARYGLHVDLALDAQDRPHLAYYVDDISGSTYGLGYSACTAGCEGSSPNWEVEFVETSDELDASNPVPLTGSCTLSVWLEVGHEPSLALDAAGQPRVSYTAKHYQGGQCSIHEDIRLVRFAMPGGSQPPPPPGGKFNLYLPLLNRP